LKYLFLDGKIIITARSVVVGMLPGELAGKLVRYRASMQSNSPVTCRRSVKRFERKGWRYYRENS